MSDVPAEVAEVAELVERRIEQLLEQEAARWGAVDARLVEAIEELRRLARGGKRLRAAFCYHAWDGSVSDADRTPEQRRLAIDAAAGFELLQTFALIHDDIMDAADMRRGETTIHVQQARRSMGERWHGEARRYGEGVALLVGDLSHVYADRLVSGAGDAVRAIWDELRIELNLGQYLDMRSSAAGETDAVTATRIAEFKSARYTIVRPLQVGATLATGTVDDELHRHFEAYGSPLGRAFQLRDDLLGVLGDPDRIGKPVGDDLREGKATELLAVGLERSDPAQRAILERVGDSELDPFAVAEMLAVLHATGSVDEIESRIGRLVVEARLAIDEMPVPAPLRRTLRVLADYVSVRTR